MNVSISQIVADLDTTGTGVQGAITAYTLVMAAFMLVGAKLGDISVALLALLSFLFTRRLPGKPSTAEQRPHPRPDPPRGWGKQPRPYRPCRSFASSASAGLARPGIRRAGAIRVDSSTVPRRDQVRQKRL